MEQLVREFVSNHSEGEIALWIANMCKRINADIADNLKDKNFELLCFSLDRMSIVTMMAKALSEKYIHEDTPVVAG